MGRIKAATNWKNVKKENGDDGKVGGVEKTSNRKDGKVREIGETKTKKKWRKWKNWRKGKELETGKIEENG